MSWLVDAADLLAEPDPSPTPWLVEGLIVDQALTAVVGKWKTTKSWGMLELGVSIATGRRGSASAAVAEPGPVVYVIEESGRRALWRRLDMLCRGRGIAPDELRGGLLLAANERVKLDDREWQERLLGLGKRAPRAFIFDPLARMKAPARDESSQTDMAPVIEFLRVLRDETDAAPVFVHHSGHQGEHMRGSSDLESAWESRLAFSRDEETGVVKVKAEHREEESGGLVNYELHHHREARTIRLRPTVLPLAERILEHLQEHGPMGAGELAKAIGTRRADVDRTLAALSQDGTTHRAPSGKRDAAGRPITAKVWHASKQAVLRVVPDSDDTGRSALSGESAGASRPVPPPKGGAVLGRHATQDAEGDLPASANGDGRQRTRAREADDSSSVGAQLEPELGNVPGIAGDVPGTLEEPELVSAEAQLDEAELAAAELQARLRAAE